MLDIAHFVTYLDKRHDFIVFSTVVFMRLFVIILTGFYFNIICNSRTLENKHNNRKSTKLLRIVLFPSALICICGLGSICFLLFCWYPLQLVLCTSVFSLAISSTLIFIGFRYYLSSCIYTTMGFLTYKLVILIVKKVLCFNIK